MPLPAPEPTATQIAESVCPGHPDKVADQVSDSVLDAFLAEDPHARVNCETLVTRGSVVVTGQITSTADVDVERTVRAVLREVGYHDPERHGLSADRSEIRLQLDRQSPEIAHGVDLGGAGDSGIVYGYATDETPERMPLSCVLAHDIARRVSTARDDDGGRLLGPDGKVQVQLAEEPGAGGETGRRAVVVVSAQHPTSLGLEELSGMVAEKLVGPALRERSVTPAQIHVNPAGTFVVGGPAADAGLTGRKLMVDSYGGLVRHGGGCCSGKDATKVDRSGAYAARYLAVNLVAAGLARRCRVGLGYAIGRPLPVWVDVDFLGTGTVDAERVARELPGLVDLRVEAVIEHLGLRSVPFRPTAAFGHYGRADQEFAWDGTTLATKFRAHFATSGESGSARR
ncbi:methionine adenosyltransferase [Streptomyces sp. NPDC001339]|uniref:methionine adenosyltransferase n=1 Tax=Streptomyces sp. NPDC001339 TaxID=3364563 RepID=UPI0036D07E84